MPIITINIRSKTITLFSKLTSFHKYLSCKASNDFILQSFHYFKKPLTKP